MERKFLVYFFTFIQWLIFVAIMPFIDRPIVATGSKLDEAIKFVQSFHLWIIFSSATLSIIFHKIITKGGQEKYVTVVLLLTTFFSSVNLALHFVDNLSLWMILTRSIAEGLYLAVGAISTVKVIIQSTYHLISYFRENQHKSRANNKL